MRRYELRINDTTHVIDVEETARDRFIVHLDEGRLVDVILVEHQDLAQALITPSVEIGQVRALPDAIPPAGGQHTGARPAAPERHAPRPRSARGAVVAPLPGVVLSVEVSPGTAVTHGQILLVLEAMKMKNELKAEQDGIIARVAVAAGDQVKHGDLLIEFEG